MLFGQVLIVFAPIVWGAIARPFLKDPEAAEKLCGDLAFRFFAPPLVFVALTDDRTELKPDVGALLGLGLSTFLTAAAIFAALMVLRRGALSSVAASVGGAYGNTVFFGLPLAMAVFGEAALGPAAVIAVFTYLTTMIAATLALASVEGDRMGVSRRAAHVVRRAATTPVLVAVPLALAFSLAGLDLPQNLSAAIRSIGALAAPIALFGVGIAVARLTSLSEARAVLSPSGLFDLLVVAVSKLVIAPGLVLACAMVIPVQSTLWWGAALLASATPTAVVAHLLIQQYAPGYAAGRLAIVVTTLASLLAAPFWAGVAARMVSG